MINLITPLNQLGYGQAGYNIAMALSKRVELYVDPIGKPDITENIDLFRYLINRSFFHNGDCIRIWHQHDMRHFIGHGRNIGWPIFELDTFTGQELHNLSYPDFLFVCSHWAKSVCTKYGIKAKVVPLGVDRSIFNEERDFHDETYIFMTVGKWEVRKGHKEIIDAFNKVFDFKDNVELWMCCENPFCTEDQKREWHNLAKNSKLGSKIRIIPTQNSHRDLARLMKMSDCGVFPSRAEGWGMPILEMMSCNKPVITTYCSAMTEYCNNDNSYLIPTKNIEPAYDGIWFKNQGNWVEFGNDQFEYLCWFMERVFKTEHRSNPDGIETAKKFSWSNSVDKILEYLK